MNRFISSKKIAIRCENQDLDTLKQLAVSCWEARERFCEAGLSVLTMKDGTQLELYTRHAAYPHYLFKNANVVTSFRVQDIQKAQALGVEKGFKNLSGIVDVCPTFSYCHLELAGGTVIGLYQEDHPLQNRSSEAPES